MNNLFGRLGTVGTCATLVFAAGCAEQPKPVIAQAQALRPAPRTLIVASDEDAPPLPIPAEDVARIVAGKGFVVGPVGPSAYRLYLSAAAPRAKTGVMLPPPAGAKPAPPPQWLSRPRSGATIVRAKVVLVDPAGAEAWRGEISAHAGPDPAADARKLLARILDQLPGA